MNQSRQDSDWANEMLHRATDDGNLDAAKQAIAAGADVNWREENSGYAPLHKACIKGYIELVDLLVQSNADVNIFALNELVTPIMLTSDREVMSILVKAGANIDHQDGDGYTALHSEAQLGHWSSVLFLLSCGADDRLKSNDGFTALELAQADMEKTTPGTAWRRNREEFCKNWDAYNAAKTAREAVESSPGPGLKPL